MTHDLRRYARQTNVRLIAGALLLLFILGDGLIYLIYGSGAAVVGILCIIGGLVPVVLVILVMMLIEWIANRANPD